MSDSDNYFSDTDQSENDDTITPGEEDEESEEEEYDEETRRMIYGTAIANENRTFEITKEEKVPKEKKKKTPKVKKNLTLSDFEKKIEDNKPKKWKSKRSKDKKDQLGIKDNVKIKKRCFNPRLPPPTYKTFQVEEEDDIDYRDASLFPTLEGKRSSEEEVSVKV
jgi:E3 ubiquitin-protein ligase DOA10